MSKRHRLIILLVSVALLLPSTRSVAAAITVPSPGTAIDPANCLVEPIQLSPLEELDLQPSPEFDLTLDESEPIDPGTPLDANDPSATMAVARAIDVIACVNAGEPLRVLALLSRDFLVNGAPLLVELSQAVVDGEAVMEVNASLLTPIDDSEWLRLVSIGDVSVLDDGRLLMSLSVFIPAYATLQAVQVIVASENGSWLVDELRLVSFGDDDIDSEGGCLITPEEISGCSFECDDPADVDTLCISPEDDGAGEESSTAPQFVEGPGYAGWIMPELADADLSELSDEFAALDVYPGTPTRELVAEAEAALPAFIAHQFRFHSSLSTIEEELNSGYFERQYLSFTGEYESYLLINGYCFQFSQSSPPTTLVSGDDPDCYWQAVYDVNAGQFIAFFSAMP